MYGSSLVSSGSELLLLVPEYASVVGTIVLPILGQLPDAAIVLFSGLGRRRTAQKQLDIGVGTLAGSSVLLLTVPWAMSVIAGRVSLERGVLNYDGFPRLHFHSYWRTLTHTGVSVGKFVHSGAYIMMGTASTYLFLQVPGLMFRSQRLDVVAAEEHHYAVVGFIISLAMFAGYMYYQLAISRQSNNVILNRRESIMRRSITSGEVSLMGVLTEEIRRAAMKVGESSLLMPDNPDLTRLRNVLRPFYAKHDPGNGTLGIVELVSLLGDIGELANSDTIDEFTKYNLDQHQRIDFDQFVDGMLSVVNKKYTMSGKDMPLAQDTLISQSKSLDGYEYYNIPGGLKTAKTGGSMMRVPSSVFEKHEDGEEQETVPADLIHLSPAEQQQRLKFRAAGRMALGMFLILIFSDPMVDVLNELGVRLGIRPFYVAFVLAPIISAGVEIMAAYSYATRQTHKSISVSLSMLQGAVCMNNTLVLAVFMYLVFARGLAWQFLAETLTVLLVQIYVGLYCLKDIHTVLDGILILLAYPVSLALITILKTNGWD
eukprot:CAMPEP_0182424912 /NCGR_PEP_ID=MMETSP1167-20130531/11188_1 /TAXON_ID=2988 /ORGANISM="Mallomonas Sp, Strain CCMP3275" /LENGTH=541 /DNA_ID=CAMNT_0024605089 /DNA_START=242 /DNA_END=1867 /DNA_ORIENTATION=+